jgi:hypothetical protein
LRLEKTFLGTPQKVIPAQILAFFGPFSAFLQLFNRLTCVFSSNFGWKLYKFGKKVIAINKFDD